MNEAFEFMTALQSHFEQVGVSFCLGGSWASTLDGTPRQTLDVDFIVELDESRISSLVAAITGAGWYVSESAMREAVRDRRSFNIIAPLLGLKADCFVRGDAPFDREEFARRATRRLSQDSPLTLPVKSAEDSVLRKLLWFRETGETSERQWRDVLGILVVRAGALDEAYLDRWGATLALTELLARARTEAAR